VDCHVTHSAIALFTPRKDDDVGYGFFLVKTRGHTPYKDAVISRFALVILINSFVTTIVCGILLLLKISVFNNFFHLLFFIMTKGTFVFFIGILLIILPYLGIPMDWKEYFYIGIGALLLVIGYKLRRAQYLVEIDRGNGERGGETFIETTKNLFPNQ